jgi:DNA-binding MarR family transcriptional regulator
MPDSESQGKAGPAGASLLFLREAQLREAQDMLFLAWRDFSASVDPLLEAAELGRAHHRALHFIGRSPGLTVSDLLGVLNVTKQSLARVLTALQARELVNVQIGRGDRRQRLLRLSEAGEAFERLLFERQRERLLLAYREAGGPAVDGFRRVLRAIMGRDAQIWLDESGAAGTKRRASL